MELYSYRIYFEDGTFTDKFASNPDAAKILAQADKINEGKSYSVIDIIRLISEFSI